MASVSRSRTFDAAAPTVEKAITRDLEAFIGAAGYDSICLEADRLELEKRLGLANLSLTLRIVEDADAVVTLEQEEGHFDSMRTDYLLESADNGTELTARTEFTLGGVVGSVLDETVVSRQRGRELEAQFEYLEEYLSD